MILTYSHLSFYKWVREFHFNNSKGRKSKICHSLDEVKKYIKAQKVKEMKDQRFSRTATDREDTNRRSSSRRKINPNQKQSAAHASISISSPKEDDSITLSPHKSSPTQQQQQQQDKGTQEELTSIMSRDNIQSTNMRQAIIYNAVIHRKKKDNIPKHQQQTVYKSTSINNTFLGCNNKTYLDLRKAFGKYINMKQCSTCKKSVQGAWYCRITHLHYDKPDYDGNNFTGINNSAECLIDLFNMNISQLEERLYSLLPSSSSSSNNNTQSIQQRSTLKMNVLCYGFTNPKYTMNMLSDDIIYTITSYIPNINDLISFCKTSRRGQKLLYGSNNVHSEKLLMSVYLRTFENIRGNYYDSENMSWKERWAMIYNLRRGLVHNIIQPLTTAISRQLRSTVGILPQQDELDAIYYDNPEHCQEGVLYCNGYFGMCILQDLPRPPNYDYDGDWEAPIIVRGDFNGIRIFNSMSDSLFGRIALEPTLALGTDDEGGQVLSLIQCGNLNVQDGPICFLGYASGRVDAVSATLNSDGNGYDFAISSSCHAHSSEVTDLTFVNCKSSREDEDVPVLFSACCGGKVYFYPNALNSEQNFSMEQSVLAFSNSYDCPIFSLASTVLQSSTKKSSSVLVTGDRDGNITLWLKSDQDLLGLSTCSGQKFRRIQKYKSSTQPGGHLVTRAKLIHDNLLITGTNNGDVRFWQLQCSRDKSRMIGSNSSLPNLSLRYDLIGIHNGAIELLVNIGNVLLTSGGNDGKIVGWDISTGSRLGDMQCHQGRQIESGVLQSCVVDLLINGKDGTFISLCRDGSLRMLKM